MFKILLVALALVSAVLAETSLEVAPKNARPNVPLPGFKTSFLNTSAIASKYIPPDLGGNFGDNLWGQRLRGDRILIRDVEINSLANYEQVLNWSANVQGTTITHIRFLNLGRQRAYVESVSSNGVSSYAVIRVAANQQFRLLIEVYGY